MSIFPRSNRWEPDNVQAALAGSVWPGKVILNLVGMLKRASLRGIFTIEIRKKMVIRTGQGNRIKAKRHDKFAALFVDFADTLIAECLGIDEANQGSS